MLDLKSYIMPKHLVPNKNASNLALQEIIARELVQVAPKSKKETMKQKNKS